MSFPNRADLARAAYTKCYKKNVSTRFVWFLYVEMNVFTPDSGMAIVTRSETISSKNAPTAVLRRFMLVLVCVSSSLSSPSFYTKTR